MPRNSLSTLTPHHFEVIHLQDLGLKDGQLPAGNTFDSGSCLLAEVGVVQLLYV